jgi:LPXTG-motif cell wall-anchored protein
MNTTWQKALAIPATVSIALGGALISVGPALGAEPTAVPTSETSAAPVAEDGAVAPVEAPAPVTDPAPEPVAEAPVTEEALVADSTPAPATEAPEADEPAVTEVEVEAPVADEADATISAAAIAAAPVVTSPRSGQTVGVTPEDGGTATTAPLTFAGTAQPGAVVKLRLDPASSVSPVRYAEVPVAADGTWSTTLTLANTTWKLTSRQYEAGADGSPVGVASPETVFSFTLETAFRATLAAPVMVTPVDGAQIEPTVADGAEGDSGPVRIVITGVPGARAEFSYREIGGNRYRTAVPEPTIPASGTLTYDAVIPSGKWRISTRQYLVSPDGLQLSEKSPVSGGRAIDLRPVTLAAPTITSPRDGGRIVADVEYPQDTFPVPEGHVGLFDPAAAFDVEGTGTPGGWVELTLADGQIIPTRVDPSGAWSVHSVERPGELRYTARAVTYADDSRPDDGEVRRISPTVSTAFSVVTADGDDAPGVIPAGTGGAHGTPTGPGIGIGGDLAYTGTDEGIATFGLIGGLLVALGLGALVVARRRRAA